METRVKEYHCHICLRQLDMSSVSEQSITSQLHNTKILYNNSIYNNQIREATEIQPHATLTGRWPCWGYRKSNWLCKSGGEPPLDEKQPLRVTAIWLLMSEKQSLPQSLPSLAFLQLPNSHILSLYAHYIPTSISSFSTSHLTTGHFPLFSCLFHLQPCPVVLPFPLSFQPSSPYGYSSWTSVPWILRKPAPPKHL
jgi:hypothetical protein